MHAKFMLHNNIKESKLSTVQQRC